MLRIRNFLLPLVLSAITMSIMTGCGTKKITTSTAGKGLEQTAMTAITDSECKAVIESYGTWERMKVPMNLKLRQPKSMSISANATMERDKSILISLRFIGMEVGVIYITSDSLLAIDKFNKRYVSEALKPLLGGFPANISNLQDLLTGRPFLLGNTNPLSTITNKFDIDPQLDTNSWSLIPQQSPKGMEYGFSFNPIATLALMVIKVGSHNPVNVFFGQPHATPSGPMASSISIEASLGKTTIDTTLEWNFQKAKWGKEIEIKKPSIPRNAERIPASKLLKSLPSL